MAKKKYEEANIQAIADTIREKTGSEQTYKTSDMVSGVAEVYEAGKKAQYDEFWDWFQNYGKRKNYGYVFYNSSGQGDVAYTKQGWTDENFYPKYDFICTYATRMFYNFRGTSFDLAERLEECGVVLDTSKSTLNSFMFQNATISRIPTIDCRGLTDTTYGYSGMFSYCSVVTIDKWILSDKEIPFSNTFLDTNKLKNITIEGVIMRNISFSACPLSVESLKNIISCLKDYSGTNSEYTYTVTFKSSAFSALEAEGATAEYNGVACTWAELIDNKKWNLVKG